MLVLRWYKSSKRTSLLLESVPAYWLFVYGCEFVVGFALSGVRVWLRGYVLYWHEILRIHADMVVYVPVWLVAFLADEYGVACFFNSRLFKWLLRLLALLLTFLHDLFLFQRKLIVTGIVVVPLLVIRQDLKAGDLAVVSWWKATHVMAEVRVVSLCLNLRHSG